jgi:hypothetical protein
LKPRTPGFKHLMEGPRLSPEALAVGKECEAHVVGLVFSRAVVRSKCESGARAVCAHLVATTEATKFKEKHVQAPGHPMGD